MNCTQTPFLIGAAGNVIVKFAPAVIALVYGTVSMARFSGAAVHPMGAVVYE
jgi:hypothetical protein